MTTIRSTAARRAVASVAILAAAALSTAGCSTKTTTSAAGPSSVAGASSSTASTASASGSGSVSGTGTAGSGTAKIAFLMPDEASTRYELYDHPAFVSKVRALCPGCSVIYNNADADAAKQQEQADSAIAQGVKAIVIDSVDSTAAASIVNEAHEKHIFVIAYDRPIPSAKPDFYVSFDNQKIGALIAQSLIDHLKATGAKGGLLEVNGSPTDAAAGLIKKGVHSVLDASGYKILAEYDTPNWAPPMAQNWVSGQITRFHGQIAGVVAANDGTGGATIAAFKAAGVNPVPPVTGNDATLAGVQLIVAGDQYNTIEKPSAIEANAAAEVALELIGGKTPVSQTTLFGTPSQLFTPTVVTATNVESAIVKPGHLTAAAICTATYKAFCVKDGIS
jgi:D-xylose transport system substrate-binding protein